MKVSNPIRISFQMELVIALIALYYVGSAATYRLCRNYIDTVSMARQVIPEQINIYGVFKRFILLNSGLRRHVTSG